MSMMLDDIADGLPALSELPAFVRHYASHTPARLAMSDEEEAWSYKSAEERLELCSAALHRLGLGREAVVAVFGNPRPECFLLFLACCKVGAVFLGLNTKHTARELKLVCDDARPRALFVMVEAGDDEEMAKVQTLSRERSIQHVVLRSPMSGVKGLSLDDFFGSGKPGGIGKGASDPHSPCALVYTSGSTGSPKGALLSQASLLRSGALSWSYWYGALREIRTVVQHPINHVAWLTCECITPMIAGGTLFFRERFDGPGTLELIEKERLNLWFVFPAMVAIAMKSPAFSTVDITSLKRVAFGSSPSLKIVRALQQRTAAVISTSYGLTEASGGAITATGDGDDPELIANSVGRVAPGVDLRLVDDQGRDAVSGDPGEVLVRDPCVFLGYLSRAADTEVSIDEDGWLHTADLATRDESGVVRLVGRKREMFKSGGYNVYPSEVERVVCECPGISAAAVVDVPDALWGRVGVGFVTLDHGAPFELSSLETFLRKRLANYKVPKRFVLKNELPQLGNGKVNKKALRDEASHPLTAGPARVESL